jgi:hypothetical protein
MKITYKAQESGADIVCFGHSHILGAEVINGTLYLNPGSIRLPRQRVEKTYVILDLQENSVRMTVYELNGKDIPGLARDFKVN